MAWAEEDSRGGDEKEGAEGVLVPYGGGCQTEEDEDDGTDDTTVVGYGDGMYSEEEDAD